MISDGRYLDFKTLTWHPIAAISEGDLSIELFWAGDRMMIFGGKFLNRQEPLSWRPQ